ncbi:MAG TPA: M36 family metallopeptidase, partial [Flavobacteriaceae bacterium]|nr:M36 family metallopeptidase [Flavobacteriaceae bacterium]
RGNNVWVQEDTDANNATNGTSPNGTSTLNFDFPLNLQQAPNGYQNAALTNLFYMNNRVHDVMYHYGFDEPAGNFQSNNYGNGGAQSDYVIADGQDATDIGNANFATPVDGFRPRMQMYLWSAPAFKNLVTVNNSSVVGSYIATNPATGIGNNIPGATQVAVTANLAIVDDGTVLPTEGCNALINGASVNGKIALIRRGSCNFTAKIQNAQNAGAVGVIMVNHNNPTNDPNYAPYINMSGSTTPQLTIPSVFVNYQDGEALIAAMLNGETVNATLQDYPVYQLDGSFDNEIIAHEYGHGISNRLTGGAGQANCLQNGEQMGEGWSDFFAYMLTMKVGDSGDQGVGIATYASGEPTTGIGIRPAKYNVDFAENDYTYGATNDDTIVGTINGQPVGWNEIPHNIGFVWATMLWDLTWAYIDKYGFDPDVVNGTGGNNRVMQVVMDGLKLQPCSPGFVQGRNAILAADMALTGGEDQCLIWEVFANRGLGLNASQGTSLSMTDQSEDFTIPAETDPTLANCTTLSVAEFNSSSYKVYPNPTDTEINISVNRDYGQANISLYDINGRTVYNAATKLNGLTKINVANLQPGIYVLNISGEYGNINEKVVIK